MAVGGQSAETRQAINLARTLPFRLGELEVSPATRQLKRGARNETLEPRVMQVLVALAQAHGAVVTRDDLIDSCWDGRIVGDNAIQPTISRLRELSLALGAGCFRLETVNKVGYRLVPQDPATVTDPVAAAGATPQRRAALPYIGAAAAVGAAAIAALALFAWTRAPASDVVTIAAVGEHGRGAPEFADGLTVDLAHLASSRANSIVFAKSADERDADYRLALSLQAGRVRCRRMSACSGEVRRMSCGVPRLQHQQAIGRCCVSASPIWSSGSPDVPCRRTTTRRIPIGRRFGSRSQPVSISMISRARRNCRCGVASPP